jgi:tetratricopeptide (TPR) repeat protein
MEDLFLEADRLISEQKIGEAFSKLESITQEMPTFGKAYNHIGWIYETKYKDYPNAEKYYKLAIENFPEYLAAYYNYAIVLSTLKKWGAYRVIFFARKSIDYSRYQHRYYS